MQVFHCELLLEKIRTCSLEITRILLQLSQSSAVTLSLQGVEVKYNYFILISMWNW